MSKLGKGVLVETVKIPKLNLCDWDFRVGPISKFSNDELENIYQLFENVWASTMRELTGVNTYFSDSFLNAQEIGVIYFKGEPVAIHLYNIYDLDFSLNHKRSIFGSLNTNCMQKLREYGKRVLSLESFTVGPTVRKDTSVGVHVAKVLCALGSHILQTRNADFISGITFNKRKVNEITEEQNYILVETGLKMHNQDVNLVVLPKQNIQMLPDKNNQSLVNHLIEKIYEPKQFAA